MLYLNDCDSAFRVDLRDKPGAGSSICELIWGDCLHPTGREDDDHIQIRTDGKRILCVTL